VREQVNTNLYKYIEMLVLGSRYRAQSVLVCSLIFSESACFKKKEHERLDPPTERNSPQH
jgi:hypothetical protein